MWLRISSLFATTALCLVYADAAFRVLARFLSTAVSPSPVSLKPAAAAHSVVQPLLQASGQKIMAGGAITSQQQVAEVPTHTDVAEADGSDACVKHEVLYGNLYADIAPWVDRGLKISERQMRDTINAIDRHRGKWDSWVTDTLTPITIIRGNVYLTLGPPKKDPTNYFWTVLLDLQTLARTHRLPDVELLLNFADTPVVYAADNGHPTPPGFPVFSYCKQSRFLDILVPGDLLLPCRAVPRLASPCLALPCLASPCLALACLAVPRRAVPWLGLYQMATSPSGTHVLHCGTPHCCTPHTPLPPGYYTPDRVCRIYRDSANAKHPWRSKRRVAFARFSHFCKVRKQVDEFGRPLPPCARSYFASLSATTSGASRLDVHPMNVVNDTSDPSLSYGQKLLQKGEGLPMADHGQYAYLLDTDGFSSAYKLQQVTRQWLSDPELPCHTGLPCRNSLLTACLVRMLGMHGLLCLPAPLRLSAFRDSSSPHHPPLEPSSHAAPRDELPRTPSQVSVASLLLRGHARLRALCARLAVKQRRRAPAHRLVRLP